MPGLQDNLDFSTLFNSVGSSSDPKGQLEELREQLLTLKIDDQHAFANRLDLRVIFDCLNSTNNDQIDMSVDIISRMMSGMSAVHVLQYCSEMQRCLQHPSTTVKQFVIFQVERCLSDAEAVKVLAQQSRFLQTFISSLGCQQMEVAAAVLRVLCRMCRRGSSAGGGDANSEPLASDTGICWEVLLFTPPLLDALLTVRQFNDTVRYRVYEVAVAAACGSAEALRVTSDAGLLTSLVSEADGDDILVQLNALDLLVTLASSNHGFSYLESGNVLSRLDNLLLRQSYSNTADEGNQLMDFTLHGLVKFFAQLGNIHADYVMTSCPGFATQMFFLINSSESAHQVASLDAVACLAMSTAGKLALEKYGERMSEFNIAVGRILQSSTNVLKLRALDCLYHMMHIQGISDEQHEERLSQLVRHWLHEVCSCSQLLQSSESELFSVEPLWRLSRLPFIEVRVAAFKVLVAVAGQSWGQHLLSNTAGFLEYLLDRSTEFCQSGRNAKYDVVTAIVKRPVTGGRGFDSSALDRLKSHYREGPFFVRAQTEVTLDQSM